MALYEPRQNPHRPKSSMHAEVHSAIVAKPLAKRQVSFLSVSGQLKLLNANQDGEGRAGNEVDLRSGRNAGRATATLNENMR